MIDKTGNGFTVTVTVCEQPPLFVYVISLVPCETPVTTPVLLTVATEGEADVHGLIDAAVAEPVKLVVAPTHTLFVPVIVGVLQASGWSYSISTDPFPLGP